MFILKLVLNRYGTGLRLIALAWQGAGGDVIQQCDRLMPDEAALVIFPCSSVVSTAPVPPRFRH